MKKLKDEVGIIFVIEIGRISILTNDMDDGLCGVKTGDGIFFVKFVT